MNIGLVLSGGMAKGAYQVGALRAISNFIPLDSIKCMSCASVGVLNGYAYAANKLDTLTKMWRNICGDSSKLFINQVLKSELLQEDIADVHSEDDNLSMHFYCALVNLTRKKLTYKNISTAHSSDVLDFLKASVVLPPYNRPIKIGASSYFDGAMVDNIPVFPLLKHRLDYIICIYFDDVCYSFENTYFDNKIIKLTFPSENVFRQSLVFTREGIDTMIKSGFERTTDILSSILHQGYEDVEYIYNAIERSNLNKPKSTRITADMLVTNLNSVTQRFAKKHIES